MKFIAAAALSALLTLLAGAAGASEPAQPVLDRMAERYGATAPAAIRETGHTTSFARGSGTLARLFRAPDRFRSEIGYASGAETRVLMGDRAWLQGAPANALLRAAIALQAARIALPWNMLAQGSAMADLGSALSVDGKPVRVFEFAPEPQIKLVVEVELETGYIVRSRGLVSVAGKSVEFVTLYSDFRSENGRTHAMREQQYASGQHIGNSVIETVEYPATIADSMFTPGTLETAQR